LLAQRFRGALPRRCAVLRLYHFPVSGSTGSNTTAVSQYTTDSPTHPGGTLSLSAKGATAGLLP
jgi:hypothetical protein